MSPEKTHTAIHPANLYILKTPGRLSIEIMRRISAQLEKITHKVRAINPPASDQDVFHEIIPYLRKFFEDKINRRP